MLVAIYTAAVEERHNHDLTRKVSQSTQFMLGTTT